MQSPNQSQRITMDKTDSKGFPSPPAQFKEPRSWSAALSPHYSSYRHTCIGVFYKTSKYGKWDREEGSPGCCRGTVSCGALRGELTSHRRSALRQNWQPPAWPKLEEPWADASAASRGRRRHGATPPTSLSLSRVGTQRPGLTRDPEAADSGS